MNRGLAILILLTSTAPVEAQWLMLSTPGVPRTPGGEPDLTAPAPRTEDGRPDLTGLWRPSRVQSDLNDPGKLQAWVSARAEEHEARFFADDPRYRCLPSGPANLTTASNSYGIRRILQHPDMIAMLYNDGTYRQIFMDGRALESDPLPTWMGYAVGHWDDDTLVVESNGYNEKTWLGSGIPHTAGLRTTERYRRPDFGQIHIDVTYDDPGAFASTLHASIQMRFVADDEMLETVCAEAYGGEHGTWTSEATELDEETVQVPRETLAKYVGTYSGIYLGNRVTVEVTLENDELFLKRGAGETARLVPQSDTAFVHGFFGYVFTADGEAMATEVSEVHVSGAWTLERDR